MAASSNRVTDDAAADYEFGSFAAAERLSDPFGDVYGADADFGDFVGGSKPADSSSLMSFSPLTGPASSAEPPTLLPSISGETDPFADITATAQQKEEKASTTRAAILDLVWGNSSQETDTNPLAASVGSGSGRSRTASSPSGFALPLPLPTATKFASFPAAAVEKETGDLLSFSPVQASAPSDPFFGIEGGTGESKMSALAFGGDELFTLTGTPTNPQSAALSLRGSFASLHEAVKSPEVLGEAPSPRDPFAERTTRSFGSLNSSFVGAGPMEEHNGTKTPFGMFEAAAGGGGENSSVTPRQSPSSAPPSLRSSFKMTDGFMGFASASAADDSDEVDPFAEAGLAAPEEVPLAEALAAWSSSADPTAEVDGEGIEEKQDDEETVADKEVQDEDVGDDQGSVVAAVEKIDLFGAANQATPANLEATALDDWQSVGTATLSPAKHSDEEEAAAGMFTTETTNVVAVESPATTSDSGTTDEQSLMPFTDSIDHGKNIESNETETGQVSPTDATEDKFHALGIQDGAFDDDESDSDEVVWPSTQSSAETKDPFELEVDTFEFSAATDITFGSSDLTHVDSFPGVASSPQHGPLSISPIAAAELSTGTDQLDVNSGREAKDSQEQYVEMDDGDNFGDFGNFESVVPATSSTKAPNASAAWGSFPSPTHAQNMAVEGDTDSFSDFGVAAPSNAVIGSASAAFENEGFGDFAQSGMTSGGDDFDDFGDFTQGSANDADGFDDFQQSSPSAFDEDGDGFGDFAPVVAPTTTAAPTISIPLLSKNDMSTFFKEAFPTKPLPTVPLDQPESQDEDETNIIQEASTDLIQDVFRSMCEEYISIVTATGRQSSSSSGSLCSASEATDGGERVRLGRKTTRASKYIKYVLSEKIQEASRQNGIFPHGSERHQMYMGFTASGDADRMRAALKELQDALFHNSVNDAMMRIAKQAALSAKAKIAEQAAQQQANSRGGSLFSTTRHLLSRGGSAAGTHGPGSSGNDNKVDHAGADTPTGASVQKLARFSFTNSHDEAASQRGANSGDERGSEGSDHTGHSSGSDSEAVSSVGDSRTRSQNFSGSGSSNGGLMKKFQDRFSFASSRHRPRFVSLRRKGQSGEEVRKMELNLDAISGGLDEVKWKCAMFLYDVEEVAHVAPSQISIVAYPSKQPLAGKTDRSALTKLVKPDTVWTVDIGANNSDMLNEW